MGTMVIPQLQQNMADDADLENRLASKGLKVVEFFSEWAGPCRSVLPTFRRIRLDKDDESALLFVTVQAELCNYLEVAKECRGRSEPLFLLYRNGQLKVRIEGADTPLLSSQILAFTPPNADVDDLEENPLYLAKMERERIAKGGAVKDNKAKSSSKKK